MSAERRLPVVHVHACVHLAERGDDGRLGLALGRIRADPQLSALAVRAGRRLEPSKPGAVILGGQALALAAELSAGDRVTARA
jgi:hypothetical protein